MFPTAIQVSADYRCSRGRRPTPSLQGMELNRTESSAICAQQMKKSLDAGLRKAEVAPVY